MFADSLELTLKAISDGRELTITVRPLTLAMKNNLDEWLRYRFLKRALDEGEDMATAERMAEGLDIFANNWFMPNLGCAARILWELCRPGMSYATFEKSYFSANLRDLNVESDVKARFQNNSMVVEEATRFAMQNPTEDTTEETSPMP
ncbi:MAG: hypothetical protein IJB48_05525 [Clostridia bacterium]|nr:hypothetical protein [Clostridia bacterium]